MSRLVRLAALLAVLLVSTARPAPAVACSGDDECTNSEWCDPSDGSCQGKLTNGSMIPNVSGHNPPLTGSCTAPAAAAVCLSSVCDNTDNRCGYRDHDGPCTPANGAVVCRSTECSFNGACKPTGGCNVDPDCAGTMWCAESSGACMSTLPNGAPIPTDPAHTNPTLNGLCTQGAGMLVCQSGVCDVDNGCGYADGDGPCTAANGATVCRSATCSAASTCRAADGCLVDADCTAGNVCSPTHVCVPAATPTPTPTATPAPTANGFVPPDDDTLGCETAVTKALVKLTACLRSCRKQDAAFALRGKPFDLIACETGTPKKSCRAKFDLASQKLLDKGTCPSCLDLAHQGALADRVAAEIAGETSALFCAGSVPLPQ